jgi:hypothetical protein
MIWYDERLRFGAAFFVQVSRKDASEQRFFLALRETNRFFIIVQPLKREIYQKNRNIMVQFNK